MQSGDRPRQASRGGHIGGRIWPWTILGLRSGHSIAPTGYRTARRTLSQRCSRAHSLDISLYTPEQVRAEYASSVAPTTIGNKASVLPRDRRLAPTFRRRTNPRLDAHPAISDTPVLPTRQDAERSGARIAPICRLLQTS